MSGDKEKNIQFIYDGECPICNHFACAIKGSDNDIELINGREKSDLLEMAKSEHLNIDDGAIVKTNGQLFYGAPAIVYLANNLKLFGLMGLFFKQLFRFNFLAKLLYPILVFVRKTLLKLMNKPLINQPLVCQAGNISVFYNSACPVCDSGIQSFQAGNNGENIIWNDIHNNQSSVADLNQKLNSNLELEFVRKRLHLLDQNGELKVGIDALITLWRVSKNEKWKAQLFSLPIIHWIARLSYNGFAWLLYCCNRLLNHW